MLGENLRKARKIAKMTQEDLAKCIGVQRSVISKYETGAIEPSISQLEKIASAFCVPVSDLVASVAYDLGFDDGSKAEEWQNYVIHELWKRDGYTGSDTELQLIKAFSRLNPTGQSVAVERVEELTKIPDYQKAENPADEG